MPKMEGRRVRGITRCKDEHSSVQGVVVAVLVLGWAGCAHQDSVEPAPSVNIGFGQRQLDQMLEDRPDMNDAIPESHPVRRWLADGFEGERAGLRVYWCGNLPDGGVAVEYCAPLSPYPAIVCVSPGAELTPIDRWAAAVYAMFAHESDWDAIGSEAGRGLLNADSFAEKCVLLEFLALKRAQEIFLEWPLPQEGHGQDRWYNWLTTCLGTYEEYKSASNSPSGMDYNAFKGKYQALFVENWQ